MQTLLSTALDLDTTPVLPNGTVLNVNYPSIDDCIEESDYHRMCSRNHWNPFADDVETCKSTYLLYEASVVQSGGCYASVSVLGASTKPDVDQGVQAEVLAKLTLSCLS